MSYNLPLHLKTPTSVKAWEKNNEDKADHQATMNQFNEAGFRKPRTGKRMLAQTSNNFMSRSEKTAVAADMMKPYVPNRKEVRAARQAPRFDSPLRVRDPEQYRRMRDAERRMLAVPLNERRANRQARRKSEREAAKAERRAA